ncbi:MAG: protein-L-isoaspartate(D-aspartate) O-methyltransferase [Puniceicoccaceae bacterium]
MKRLSIILAAATCLMGAVYADGKTKAKSDDYHFARQRLVTHLAQQGIKNKAVLQAMREVRRHEFMPSNLAAYAYEDRPLPIGHGQTISQPYIVALMTELLDLEPDDNVLEVGTGQGYQAAVLGKIVKDVTTIEIVKPLATKARANLEKLGYTNIKVVHGDGYHGYKSKAPFDAIIVTAAPEQIPPPLLQQLKPGGRLVIPVGKSGRTQKLQLIKKDLNGVTTTKTIIPVRFVPFTRTKR